MKSILSAIKSHYNRTASGPLLAAICLWISMLVALNYTLDLEDGIVDKEPLLALRLVYMFLLHFIPWLGVCALLRLFSAECGWFGQVRFWILAIVGFAILALDRSISIQPLAVRLFEEPDRFFLSRVLSKGKGIVGILLPIGLLAWLVEKNGNRLWFGMRGGIYTPKPYLIMLAVTAIFIFIGGYFTDIQAHYPKYLNSWGPELAAIKHWNPVATMLLYELPYGLSFISTEYFFRGFLIIGLARYMGPHAVLPMVATYAALHFGKPLTETISSVFGGYILGVLALYHRNIWGGVIIHVGVAWLMECVAYIHRVWMP